MALGLPVEVEWVEVEEVEMEKVEVEKVEEKAVEVSLEEDGVVIDELVALCIDVDAIHGKSVLHQLIQGLEGLCDFVLRVLLSGWFPHHYHGLGGLLCPKSKEHN